MLDSKFSVSDILCIFTQACHTVTQIIEMVEESEKRPLVCTLHVECSGTVDSHTTLRNLEMSLGIYEVLQHL